MNLAGLIAQFRTDTGDTASPYAWDDAFVTAALNEAEREAALRKHLLYDNTSDFCSIAVNESASVYTLDPLVYEIYTARIITSDGTVNYGIPLYRELVALDRDIPGWRAETAREPYAALHLDGSVQLVPEPDTDYTLEVDVYRLPLADMIGSVGVTFQDAGDTVTHAAHGRLGGDRVVFGAIASTTGISVDTEYFIRDVTTDTYKLAATSGGAALALTTNGTGTAEYGSNGPEIAAVHHQHLVSWAKYRAYLVPDTDFYDRDRAALHLAEFEAWFGARPNAATRKTTAAPMPRARPRWC